MIDPILLSIIGVQATGLTINACSTLATWWRRLMRKWWLRRYVSRTITLQQNKTGFSRIAQIITMCFKPAHRHSVITEEGFILPYPDQEIFIREYRVWIRTVGDYLGNIFAFECYTTSRNVPHLNNFASTVCPDQLGKELQMRTGLEDKEK